MYFKIAIPNGTISIRNRFNREERITFLLGINSAFRISDNVKLRKMTLPVPPSADYRVKDGIYPDTLPEQYARFDTVGPERDAGGGPPIFERKGRAYRSQHGLLDIPKGDRFSRIEKRRDAYMCRKTFGHLYYQRIHDIATLMGIFRHSSDRITKRYIGLREEEISNTLKNFRLGF